jgi:Flp pilus assembly protein TadG
MSLKLEKDHMLVTTKQVREQARSYRGVAAVEFAITLPLLLLLTAGLWEVGVIVNAQQTLSNAAHLGGRQASTGLNTTAQVETAVTQYLQIAGIPTTNLIVTVTDVTSGGDVSNANQMDQLTVSVSIHCGDVVWDDINYLLPSAALLSANVTWYSMVDTPVTVSTTLPIQ